MRKILLALFLPLSLMWACKTTQYTPDTFEGRKLLFAQGGGVTGKYDTFLLMENGQLFTQETLDGEWQEKASLKKKQSRSLFSQLDALSMSEMSYNSPGNMTYYVELQDGDSQQRLTWGSTKTDVEPALAALHKALISAAKNAEDK